MQGQTTGDLERYEVVDRYAVGGAAELYRARDKHTGRVVILKRMRPDLDFDPAVGAGFLREVQLAMLSRHKNLVRGFDKGTHQGLDWVALEFVEGSDLAQLIEREKAQPTKVPLELYLFIAREILEGLAFAHGLKDPLGQPMGLVHRDLNPRNILISYDGSVHVADFGSAIATLIEPDAEEVVGSPGYLSPEQARLEPLDARSDIFAVGCILYELVARQPAFDFAGRREDQLLKLHQKGQIRRIPAEVPAPIALIIEVACAANREDRYPNAGAMLSSLDEARGPWPLPELQRSLGAMMRVYFGGSGA